MNKTPEPPESQHLAETYEIRLRGHLNASWADQLGVPNLTHEADGTTLLSGVAADQAALHGLLQRIRDLALPLVSVVRVKPDKAD